MKYDELLGCGPGNRCPDYPNCNPMKIKTLNDFKATGIYPQKEISFVQVHNSALTEVKQEAIKWVKYYREKAGHYFYKDKERSNFNLGKSKGIMDFNNLTEKDLK